MEILRRLNGQPGVLPLLDAEVPASPSQASPAWLAMPRATPIKEALAEATLEDVVADVAHVATTLADLQDQGIYHRDIKAENLLRHDGEATLADFGLAVFPDKEQVTVLRGGRHPGPIFYLAPELLNARTVDYGSTDVYALAKTLWVLATGQSYPLGGQLSVGNAATRLSAIVLHPRAHLLDGLLERSTEFNASARPSMRAFAEELVAWGSPPGPLATPDLESLPKQLAAVMEPSRRKDEDRQRLIGERVRDSSCDRVF